MSERSVNKAILVGRLGSDADTFYTQSGKPVSRLSLAMNRQWMDSSRQIHEETDGCPSPLEPGELAQYLTKGTRLFVEGRLQTRSYEDKEGIKRYVTEVVAENDVRSVLRVTGTSCRQVKSPQLGFDETLTLENFIVVQTAARDRRTVRGLCHGEMVLVRRKRRVRCQNEV